jgi:hypothetical protein
MITYEVCRKMLESDGKTYSDEQVKLIVDLLWEFANLSIEQCNEQQKIASNETSSINGKSK